MFHICIVILTYEFILKPRALYLICTAFRYPLDIIRRRMQTDGMLSARLGYGFFAMIKHVWRTEGLRAFYKGVTMNWIKVGLLDQLCNFCSY